MNAVKTRTTAPAITVCNGLATVLTTNISAVFEKNHRHVLRDVEDIIQRTPEDRRGNFIPVELERPSNLGKGIVKYKAYALTKAGFTFLAMGFTGEKADKFKWAYIDEFDRMEKALSGEGGPDYIDEAQQREIQKAVGRRASGAPKNFRVIYSALNLWTTHPLSSGLPLFLIPELRAVSGNLRQPQATRGQVLRV